MNSWKKSADGEVAKTNAITRRRTDRHFYTEHHPNNLYFKEHDTMGHSNHERFIKAELIRAKNLHPDFPTDLIHQIAIMAEESGEAMRAALNHVYHGEPISHVEEELIQVGAMVYRCLEAIKNDGIS